VVVRLMEVPVHSGERWGQTGETPPTTHVVFEGQIVNLVLGRETAPRRVAPPEVGPSTRLGGFWRGDCPLLTKWGVPDADHDGFACSQVGLAVAS
jgi:hypothetical protein